MKTKSLIYLAIVFVHTFINLGASTLEPTGAHYALRYTLDASSARFSPDSAQIITVSNRIACTWDTETGEKLMSLGDITHAVGAQFSPDNKRIAVASEDGVGLYDAFSGDLINKTARFSAATVTFSPCGQFIASSSHDTGLYLWNVSASGDNYISFNMCVSSVSFGPNGLFFVRENKTDEPKACIRNLHNYKFLKELSHSIDRQCDSAFNSDGKHILVCCAWTESCLLNTETGEFKRELTPGCFPTFSRDGKRFAFYSVSGKSVYVSDLQDTFLKELPSAPSKPSFSADGKLIAVINGDTVSIFDTQTWQCVQALDNLSVSTVQFSFDDKYLMVTVPRENKVFVYENIWLSGAFDIGEVQV
jgi:WD40 repeat protein